MNTGGTPGRGVPARKQGRAEKPPDPRLPRSRERVGHDPAAPRAGESFTESEGRLLRSTPDIYIFVYCRPRKDWTCLRLLARAVDFIF